MGSVFQSRYTPKDQCKYLQLQAVILDAQLFCASNYAEKFVEHLRRQAYLGFTFHGFSDDFASLVLMKRRPVVSMHQNVCVK